MRKAHGKTVRMRNYTRVGLFLITSLLLALAVPAPAQTSPDPGTASPLYNGLNAAFNLNDTNSLVNANEINITPLIKWNSAESVLGGGLNVDWWVTDQQGAFLGFEEYSNRKSYFAFGYGARTVFNSVEVSVQFGTRQDNDDPFGEVQLFLRPTASVRILDREDIDLRLALGCDISNRDKPNPFFGLTLRAFRF